jgi:magnesium chelatase accessory protein
MKWQQHAHDWPQAKHSRFVVMGAGQWHTQCFGQCGPGSKIILMLHGTGASTHSWRDVAPALSESLGQGVVCIDLPGHGFTSDQVSRSFSLPDVAQAVINLLELQQWQAPWVIGHSAGAAIAAQMNLARQGAGPHAHKILGLNGAFVPLQGRVQRWFSPMAKVLALNPLIPAIFSMSAQRDSVVRGLLNGTGSVLDNRGQQWYAKLMRDPDHAAAALQLMAQWNLDELWQRLAHLRGELHLWAGQRDRTVTPKQADQTALQVPDARVRHFEAVGHLMHEEQPEFFAQQIEALVRASTRSSPSDKSIQLRDGEIEISSKTYPHQIG